MRITSARFEGNFAGCEKEDRVIMNIRREELPAGAAEGDILIIEGDTVSIDSGGTARRRKRIGKLMKGLWK